MGFYYISLFSIFPLGIAWGVLGVVYWRVARAMRGKPYRLAVLGMVAALFLLAPLSEELWIAWNFGRACKDAGTFISRTVFVDGFYDDTTGWGPRQLAESKYTFMESRDILANRLIRVERTDAASRDHALAWYADNGPKEGRLKGPFVIEPISKDEQVVVAPNRIDAWRVMTIERPTARYQYRSRDHLPYSLKVVKHESVVVDSEGGELLGRQTIFGRYAPWFFIGLDAPVRLCYGTRPVKGLVYQNVLLPKG